MKTRQMENSPTISVRMSNEEWEELKTAGEKLFSDRNVGYMQVTPGSVFFEKTSAFYKDMLELDNEDKLKSDETIINEEKVAAEIKSKGGK